MALNASSAGFHSVALYSFAFSILAYGIIEILTFQMGSPGLGIREGMVPLKVQVALLLLQCNFLQLWIGNEILLRNMITAATAACQR